MAMICLCLYVIPALINWFNWKLLPLSRLTFQTFPILSVFQNHLWHHSASPHNGKKRGWEKTYRTFAGMKWKWERCKITSHLPFQQLFISLNVEDDEELYMIESFFSGLGQGRAYKKKFEFHCWVIIRFVFVLFMMTGRVKAEK